MKVEVAVLGSRASLIRYGLYGRKATLNKQLQNSVVLKARKRDHVSLLLRTLHWLIIQAPKHILSISYELFDTP